VSTYREWQPSLHPTPLAGRWGAAWGAGLGTEKDRVLGLAREAVTVRGFPADDSGALDRAGSDRGIPRLSGEALASYRARLAGAWESWSWAGTSYGVALAVGLLGYGTPVVRPVRYWHPGTSRPWAMIRVVYTGRLTWGCWRWGTTTSDGPRWGSRFKQGAEDVSSSTLRAQLRPLLRQWIGARDRVESVRIAWGSILWGRARWGAFAWGSGTAPSTVLSAPPWGTSTFGAFTWGAFC
jgi:hypothetical protein